MPFRYRLQIDAVQAPHVDGPQVWRRSGSTKRQNAAGRAEVILRGLRVPLVEGHVLQGRKRAKLRRFDTMIEGTPLPTQRAIADSNVVEIHVDFESDRTTVTGSLVGRKHVNLIPIRQQILSVTRADIARSRNTRNGVRPEFRREVQRILDENAA